MADFIGLHFVHRFTSAPILSDVVVEMFGLCIDMECNLFSAFLVMISRHAQNLKS